MAPTREPDQKFSTFGPWADGRDVVSVLVIVNEKAGSVGVGARKTLLAKIEALGGRAIKTVSDLDELTKRDAEGADVVVVLGGDGTARMAAEMFNSGPPLVLLPGGTLNVLSHALYGRVAWPEALQKALTQGRIVQLIGGEANGRKFFVAAMFGAPTLLARAREAARSGRFRLMLSRLKYAFSRAFSHRLAVRPAGGAASRAEGIGVLCPAYSGEVEGRALEWVRLNAAQILDFLRVGMLFVVGGWRGDSAIEVSKCERGEIRSIGIIPALLDGEPTTFLSHVRIRMVANGPKVLVA